MDIAKALAGGLALNRVAFGLGYLLRPQQARGSWIGRTAEKPPAQVIIRSQGVRDIALGAGALRALSRNDASELRRWLLGHGISDLTDLIATWAARDHLPTRQAKLAMAIAGGSTATAALAVLGLQRNREPRARAPGPPGSA